MEKIHYLSKYFWKEKIFYASSQLCHICEYQKKENKNLHIRDWICPNCNIKHDKDKNAAINILQEGLKLMT